MRFLQRVSSTSLWHQGRRIFEIAEFCHVEEQVALDEIACHGIVVVLFIGQHASE